MKPNWKTRCTAKSKSTGERCARPPIAGATVCRVHGGAAPQVKQSARERLASLVDPAITTLDDMVRQRQDKKVALVASRDILDRNDLGAKQKVEHSGSIETGLPVAFSLSPETLRAIRAEMDAAGVEVVEVEEK